MKKFRIGVLGVLGGILVSILLVACFNDSDLKDKSRVKAKDLECIGIEHNKMLASTLFELKRLNEEENHWNQFDLKEFLKGELRNNPIVSEESLGQGYESIDLVFKNAKRFNRGLEGDQINLDDVAAEARPYLKRLFNLFDNLNVHDNSIFNEIEKLERDISSNERLANNDLVLLYAATQTGKYSFEYWSQHMDEWRELGNAKGVMKDPGEVAGNIVKADIEGAVGGAVGALAVNVAVGPGQVAYGGAILGGAAGNSAIEAFSYLLDWAWNK